MLVPETIVLCREQSNICFLCTFTLNSLIMLFLENTAVPDTCLLENGGCDHFCDEDEGGRRLNCSCADGYFLDVDGQSCVAKGGRHKTNLFRFCWS